MAARTRHRRSGYRQQLSAPLARRTPPAAALHSASRTPPTTSRTVVEPPVAHHVPHRPGRPGLRDPRRRTPGATTRASTAAPAHMVHGSSVTASVQPVSCQEPSEAPARAARSPRRARSGRASASRSLCAMPDDRSVCVEDDGADRDVGRTYGAASHLQRGVHRREVAAAGLHGLRRQARRSSNRSPQPAFSHTATSTSTGSVPSWPHRSSRSAAGVPRSSAIAGSPNGACRGSAGCRRGCRRPRAGRRRRSRQGPRRLPRRGGRRLRRARR